MTRTDVLNHLAEKYNLQRYLEIGVQNPTQNFDKIKCTYKVGVDPDPEANATFCKTSDEFFESSLKMQIEKFSTIAYYDLVFIDGLHFAPQVESDFINSIKILNPNAFIVLHDCNPLEETHTAWPRPNSRGHWNGSCYQFVIGLRENAWFYTVDVDNGCGVYRHISRPVIKQEPDKCRWEYFDKHRKELLNLISWDEFIKL